MSLLKTIFDVLLVLSGIGILVTTLCYFLFHLIRFVIKTFLYKKFEGRVSERVLSVLSNIMDYDKYRPLQILLILTCILFVLIFLLAVLGLLFGNNLFSNSV